LTVADDETRHRLIDRRRRTTIPFCRQHHDAACRFPRQTYRLGKYEQRFRLRVAHILFDDRRRHVRHERKCRNHFFNSASHREFLQFAGGQ